ncbi:MAG: HD domain-containing protein [Natronomonas sp.]
MVESDPERGITGRQYDPEADHPFPDERLNAVLDRITTDEEITAYLEAQNVNPVDRMGYNDHGTKHIEIVRDRALTLYELLKSGGVSFNAPEHGLSEADEPVVVALAATLHDIGHVVHRDDHSYYSIPLAADVLDRLLSELPWYDIAERVQLKGEVLHAILCHHAAEKPLTNEAGIVRVADGLDMERGRSRRPYEKGGRGINTLSSRAIRAVRLTAGTDAPVSVEIEMTSAVGVYQVDELLKSKLEHSRIERYIDIVAVSSNDDDELVDRIEL